MKRLAKTDAMFNQVLPNLCCNGCARIVGGGAV